MELFEQIRREHTHGVGTIQGTAKTLGVHRRMVRPALATAVPPERKPPVRLQSRLEPVLTGIMSTCCIMLPRPANTLLIDGTIRPIRANPAARGLSSPKRLGQRASREMHNRVPAQRG